LVLLSHSCGEGISTIFNQITDMHVDRGYEVEFDKIEVEGEITEPLDRKG